MPLVRTGDEILVPFINQKTEKEVPQSRLFNAKSQRIPEVALLIQYTIDH